MATNPETKAVSPERDYGFRFAKFMRSADYSDVANQRITMFNLGHFQTLPWVQVQYIGPGSDTWHLAVSSLQSFANLDTDGRFGPKTAARMRQRRCGCRDIEARQSAGIARWEIAEIIYHYFDDNGRMPMYADSFADWQQYIPRDFVPWTEGQHGQNELNIYAQTKRVDGPGGVLAHSGWLRQRGGPETQMSQVYDVADGGNQLQGTMTHEIGHAIGYDERGQAHSRDPDSIMFAYMNGTTKVMPVDVKMIQSRYGKRVDPPPPPPPPPPEGGVMGTFGSITHEGEIYDLTLTRKRA